MKGEKTGGRTVGTPNKEGREVKAFLDRVFTRAFTESRPDNDKEGAPNRTLEDRLVDRIITLSIDSRLLVRLLDGYGGKPAQQHDLRAKVSLEDLIAGTVDEPGAEDE